MGIDGTNGGWVGMAGMFVGWVWWLWCVGRLGGYVDMVGGRIIKVIKSFLSMM